MIFGHYIRNFVQSYACFSAFWNLTGKANKTDPIRPLLPAIGLEGARAHLPLWIRPVHFCPPSFLGVAGRLVPGVIPVIMSAGFPAGKVYWRPYIPGIRGISHRNSVGSAPSAAIYMAVAAVREIFSRDNDVG